MTFEAQRRERAFLHGEADAEGSTQVTVQGDHLAGRVREAVTAATAVQAGDSRPKMQAHVRSPPYTFPGSRTGWPGPEQLRENQRR